MIDVNVGRTHIEFVLQGGIARAVIVSRLPDAQFPPYEKVIPTGVIEISVAAPIVDDLCARVATVVKLTTAKSTNGIVLQFNADKVCIESVDANYNDHEEDSSGLKFCVNPRYLLDAMRGVEGQTLLVRGDNQPLQLVSVTTMALVMPMRL
jgi:DNA polymerase III sliding clamp (beta) subunit (PCNA family)